MTACRNYNTDQRHSALLPLTAAQALPPAHAAADDVSQFGVHRREAQSCAQCTRNHACRQQCATGGKLSCCDEDSSVAAICEEAGGPPPPLPSLLPVEAGTVCPVCCCQSPLAGTTCTDLGVGQFIRKYVKEPAHGTQGSGPDRRRGCSSAVAPAPRSARWRMLLLNRPIDSTGLNFEIYQVCPDQSALLLI